MIVSTRAMSTPMAMISGSSKNRWNSSAPHVKYSTAKTMEIIFPIRWQMVPYILAASGLPSPRLLPQRATAATCIPSPKEKDRFIIFIPT